MITTWNLIHLLIVLWYWACSYRRDFVHYLLSSAALFLLSSLLEASPISWEMTGPCSNTSVAFVEQRARMTYGVGAVVLSSSLAAAGGVVLDLMHGVGGCV
jgi:hypothetical protein